MTSKTERILAIDPGERVGWARARVEHNGSGALFVPERRGVTPLKDFALALGKRITDYDYVIYETWRLYPEMGKKMVGNDMQPSQLVGIIRYLAWITPNTKLVSQGAQIKNTALKTMPDELTRSMGDSSEQHDQDALMHAWHWYWTRYVT